jgi:hypothetical protein
MQLSFSAIAGQYVLGQFAIGAEFRLGYNLAMHKLLKQQLVIWLAILSVLFGALAPTVSHKMAASEPAKEEVQLCTKAGIVKIAVDRSQANKPAAPTPDHMFKHCPYCATHGGTFALLPVPNFVFPFVRQQLVRPALFFQSMLPLFAWTVAEPRAPPTIA